MHDSKPDSLLPLPTAVFHILIALADRDRHGYSIMQDVAARTGGKVQLITFAGLDHQLEDSAARTRLLAESDAFLRAAMGQ